MTAEANAEQERYWNEDAGPRWVELAPFLDRQLARLGEAAMAAARPVAGEYVLDVGCGAGATSRALAAAVTPGGLVLGVDISEPLLGAARAQASAEAGTELSFRQGDAEDAELGAERFDLVFSRFGVMFFAEPDEAFANLRAAAKAGGRLAFVCWQRPADNEWSAVPARALQPLLPPAPPPDPLAPGPFALADPERVRAILGAVGWTDVAVTPLVTTILVGGTTDFEEAMQVSMNVGPVGRALLTLAAEQRPPVIAAMRESLRPYFVEGTGCTMGAACWIVTASNPG